jgi:uncharacterized membrane protein YgcG
MMTPRKLLPLAALAGALAGSGCLYQREVVREPPPIVQSPPPPPSSRPPPPPDDEAGGPPPSAQAEADIPPAGQDVADEQVFYERLSPYGHWEWVPEYGRVWVPAVAPGWRPYVYGRWALTEWGWTWVSDDPWAWAAYHYGTWGFTMGAGWFWVPGRVWAPAWVTWRWGFGYCAWAPIGPHGFVGFGFRHPGWVAVRAEHFTQPISVHVVAVQQTGAIVQRASPLAGPRATPARGVAFGPPVAQVASATGQTVRPVSAGAVVGARPQWSRNRQINPAPGGARATGSPAQSPRAQSPMQSPRAQPSAPARSSGGGWKRNWSQPSATSRAGAAGWGGPRAASPARWGSAPVVSGARASPGASGGVRSAPSAPRASAAPQGGGGAHSGGAPSGGAPSGGGHSGGAPSGGGHSGGAHSSGGHGRR